MPRKPNIAKKERYHDAFPSALRELMDVNETTQETIKTVLGLNNRQSVTGYVDGSTIPTADKIIAIANYYNVSADYLLFGDEDKKSRDPDVKVCRDYTGLSETAIEYLADYRKYGSPFLYLLADMIISDIGGEIGIAISQAGHCAQITDIYEDSDIAPFVYSSLAQGDIEKTVLPDIPPGAMVLSASDASEFYKAKAVKMFSALVDSYIERFSKARSEK